MSTEKKMKHKNHCFSTKIKQKMMNNNPPEHSHYDDDDSYASYYSSDDAILDSDNESLKDDDDDYLDYETREWQRNQFYKKQKQKELEALGSAKHLIDDPSVVQPVDNKISKLNPWTKIQEESPIMSLADIMKCQTKETEEEKIRIENEKRQKQEQAKKKRSFHFSNNGAGKIDKMSTSSTKPRFNLKHNKNTKDDQQSTKPRFLSKKKV